MKIALAFAALIAGATISTWLAFRIVRQRPGETLAEATTRIGRRVVAGMGYMVTALLVMVVWQQDTADESRHATELALEVGEDNCRSQRSFESFIEDVLIADVRIARTQYTAAVAALLAADASLSAELPDLSALPVEVIRFVEALAVDSRARAAERREAIAENVRGLATELRTRESTLDEARARSSGSDCPRLDD